MNKRYPLLLIVALMCTSGTSLTQSIANSRPDAATVLTSADGKYTSSSGAFSSFAPFGGSRMLVQKKAFNVIFSFDSPTVANRFGMQTGGDYFNSARGPKAWKIYGSNDYVPSADRKTDDTAANDAANWIELYSVEEETEWDDSGEYRYYEFPNPTPYRSYKIEVSDNNGESYTQWQYIEYLYEPETSIWVAGNPSEFSDGTLPAPAFGYYAYPSELLSHPVQLVGVLLLNQSGRGGTDPPFQICAEGVAVRRIHVCFQVKALQGGFQPQRLLRRLYKLPV